MLTANAKSALSKVGAGKGAVHGTLVHTEFAKLNSLDDIAVEISYLKQDVVKYGTKGSVRVDAVKGNPLAPLAIGDLKCGSACLTSQRIEQIRDHLPRGYQGIPIHEIRP